MDRGAGLFAAHARRAVRAADVAFGLFCCAALASLIWPGYAWLGNRVRPLVLGLPFNMAWIVGWILASLVALSWYERALRKRAGGR